MKRSQQTKFIGGMEQKDHILRLARGAQEIGVSFDGFVAGLESYVNDESAIDEMPLAGWWRLGGPHQTQEEIEEEIYKPA